MNGKGCGIGFEVIIYIGYPITLISRNKSMIIKITYKYGALAFSPLHPACEEITKNFDSFFHSFSASANNFEDGNSMIMVDSEHMILLTLSSISSKVTAGNLYLIDVVANLECAPLRMESSKSN